MIGCPEYTLSLPPTCPTNRDHLILPGRRFEWFTVLSKRTP